MSAERLTAALADRYRIERELGAGGMATVYLAEDLKHDRKVAIKVLKPELAAVLGAERFVVEIKTTAALSHPHILPLFDSGTADGFLYYVMPFIKGETIREKLNRETQFGVDEAVRIAREVADALDYAHRNGVIHRDIKPENILLHDGRAMVMDFGIALAVSAAAGGRMTETGLSLGTPHYMSPEQATAEKEVSARSDVYSLGSVLYEMLTGQPPHVGGSSQQVIMKIITAPAEPVTVHRKSVPTNVAAAVAKSLEKLPADRFETATRFAEALGNPAYMNASMADAGATGALSAARKGRQATYLASAVAVLAIIAAIAGWMRRSPEPVLMRARFTIDLDSGAAMVGVGPRVNLAVSPDGQQIAYVGGSSSNYRLYLRRLDDLTATPIAGTDGGVQPRFSPDGRWIAFTGQGALKKVAITGGSPVTIADSVGTYDWGDGDFILFSRAGAPQRSHRGLWRVSAQGGSAEQVTTVDTASETGHGAPFILPGGKTAVFGIAKPGVDSFVIAAIRLSDWKMVRLEVRGRSPTYAGGHIIYTVGRQTMALPFDERGLRTSGIAVPVLEDVAIKTGGAADFSVSRNGTLVYSSGRGGLELVAQNRQGGKRVFLRSDESLSYPRFSPDGKRIAVVIGAVLRTGDIWIYEIASSTLTRLTTDGRSVVPLWTPDSRYVIWTTVDSAGSRIYRQPWDASQAAELLVDRDQNRGSATDIAPSGAFILTAGSGQQPSDPAMVQLDVTRRVTPLAGAPGAKSQLRISADSRWLAYTSRQSGEDEVYVEPLNGPSARHQVSAGGGREPMWAHDGSEIYYRQGDLIVAAKITTSPEFRVLQRDTVMARGGPAGVSAASYDVSPDGNQFLISTRATAERGPVVVIGWLDEFRARLAQGNRK